MPRMTTPPCPFGSGKFGTPWLRMHCEYWTVVPPISIVAPPGAAPLLPATTFVFVLASGEVVVVEPRLATPGPEAAPQAATSSTTVPSARTVTAVPARCPRLISTTSFYAKSGCTAVTPKRDSTPWGLGGGRLGCNLSETVSPKKPTPMNRFCTLGPQATVVHGGANRKGDNAIPSRRGCTTAPNGSKVVSSPCCVGADGTPHVAMATVLGAVVRNRRCGRGP